MDRVGLSRETASRSASQIARTDPAMEGTSIQVDARGPDRECWNALTAGITDWPCIYGLMWASGLGLIFGIMKVVNFAQGELLMLGMFASFYLVTGGEGCLAFLGPVYRAICRHAILAGPIVVRVWRVAAPVFDQPGVRPANRGLRLTMVAFRSVDRNRLGISLILQNGGMIVFGTIPQTVRTPLSSSAFLIGPVYGDATIFLNKAKLVACAVAIVTALILYFVLEYTPDRQSLARGGG